MKISQLILLATAALGLALSTSCATTKGFGQDLQKVGNRLENQADATGGAAPASSSSDVSAY
jgi:predicted small secreted protein